MRRFEEYPVWRLAHEMTLQIYRSTRHFPIEERYGLTAQLRRSASSIASNIAEGSARPQAADFARFLDIAAGSTNEVLYQLRLSADLGYLSLRQASLMREQGLEIARMLGGLRRHVRSAG